MKNSIFVQECNVKFSSELVILAGLYNEEPNDDVHNIGIRGFGRYAGLNEELRKLFNYTDNLQEAEYLVLPYKFTSLDDSYLHYLENEARKINKPLLAFAIDDDETVYDLPSSMYLFRSSVNKKMKNLNERPMPAFTADFFQNKYITKGIPTIGYCGHTLHGRKELLQILENSPIKTNFIIRSGFWAPEIDNKYVAKQIFIKNMEENLFNFCTRGAGNFSYRFYETLMMGRIPIFIDTECELPFEEQLKGNATVLRLKSLDPDSLILLEYKMQEIMNLDPSYLREIQNKNRQFWLNYYSPLGFCKTLIKAII